MSVRVRVSVSAKVRVREGAGEARQDFEHGGISGGGRVVRGPSKYDDPLRAAARQKSEPTLKPMARGGLYCAVKTPFVPPPALVLILPSLTLRTKPSRYQFLAL